ncbi:hypothetical protein BKA69DRAFT_1060795 [Paraphysoderma sedebokerense]|nr:hypothetical protein BKA69DRAFT_1060795 [Paraphysoderma sedebokerense]
MLTQADFYLTNYYAVDSRQANGLLRANSEDLSSGDSLCDISQQTIDTTALTIQITKSTSPSASFSGRSPTSESHSSHSAHSANSAISASSGEPVTPLTAVSEVSTTELPTWDDDGKGSHHYDVLPIPHRFTLVNHQSLLPSLVKCAVCHRRIKYQKHLVCDVRLSFRFTLYPVSTSLVSHPLINKPHIFISTQQDCPAQVHRRCAANAPSNCGMKHGLKDYHQRYIKDLVYREQQQNSMFSK